MKNNDATNGSRTMKKIISILGWVAVAAIAVCPVLALAIATVREMLSSEDV